MGDCAMEEGIASRCRALRTKESSDNDRATGDRFQKPKSLAFTLRTSSGTISLVGCYRASIELKIPLRPLLILKGGNCFRKAYFEHARFSNDVDFSTQTELDVGLLLQGLKQACALAGEKSGVEFLIDDSRILEKRLADSESQIYEARIYFKSFYGEEDARIRVDLDVKEYDRIFLPIQSRRLIHSYSDAQLCQGDIRCLKLEELLASKLKALLQRRHSRTCMTSCAVFFQKTLNISRQEVLSTFSEANDL